MRSFVFQTHAHTSRPGTTRAHRHERGWHVHDCVSCVCVLFLKSKRCQDKSPLNRERREENRCCPGCQKRNRDQGEYEIRSPGEVLFSNWTKAPVLGFLASVLDQDSGNMPFVQQGIKNLESGTVQLADYNEMKLRHFYKKLDEYLAKI